MLDSAMVSKTGGRELNEDYVTMAIHGDAQCFVICDGLGGHDCGEIASRTVANSVAKFFEERGDFPSFFDDAIKAAQEELLALQKEKNVKNGMKTTLSVLVVTSEQIKWAHIGDSRVYHIFGNGQKYERTKDHSIVQMLLDIGEIDEKQVRNHEDRNKLLRVMGAAWGNKSYDKSAILEREGKHQFALMTDGFWEKILEEEMLECLNASASAKEWLELMTEIVEKRLEEDSDNYSAICIRIE